MSCLSYKFSKASRLLSPADFKLSRKGRRFVGDLLSFSLFFHREKESPPRLGITVSKKYGNSVARNRFKRCVREGFRLSQDKIKKGLWIIIYPKEERKDKEPIIFTHQVIEDLKKAMEFLG